MPCNGLSLLQRNLLWSIIKKGHVMTFYLCFPCHRETPHPVNLNNHLNIMNLSAIYHGSVLVRQYRNMDCGLWSYDFNNIFLDLSNRLGFVTPFVSVDLCYQRINRWYWLSGTKSLSEPILICVGIIFNGIVIRIPENWFNELRNCRRKHFDRFVPLVELTHWS